MPEMQAPRLVLDDRTGIVPSPADVPISDQPPMSDGELIAYMDRELAAAQTTGDISLEREDGLRFYKRHRDIVPTQEGRSQVVAGDVGETVQWIMDMLLPMFTSGDRYVEFDAVGEEDEDQAAQETDYVDYVVQKKNRGYYLLETWFQDALVSKNGAVIAYPKRSIKKTPENYTGLTQLQLTELMNDPSYEATAHQARQEPRLMTDMMTGQSRQVLVTVHDLEGRRSKEDVEECIECIPPEELLISADCRSIYPEDARLVGRRRRITESDLVEMGFDPSFVKELPSEEPFQSWMTNEHAARYDRAEEYWQDPMGSDRTRRLWMVEAYLKVDWDRDGIAERRRILRAGNRILENEEIDHVPIYVLSPFLLSHKFYGESVADLVKDLQEIRTVLWRQMLDNLYLSNTPQEAIDESGVVDMDEWETSKPGAQKRTTRDPNTVHKTLVTPFVADKSYSMFDYLDQVAKNRTGASRDNAGPTADALQNVNTGVYLREMDIAERKVERIARIFAETGVTELFRGIHRDLQRTGQNKEAVRLRGKWVHVSPQEWRDRFNITVNVGLGSGNKAQQVMALNAIKADQEMLWQSGGRDVMVTAEQMFNTRRKMIEAAGLRNVGLYYTDPESEEAKAALQQRQQQEQQKLEQQNAMLRAQLQALQQQLMQGEKGIIIDQSKLLLDAEKEANRSSEKRSELELKYQADVPGALV